MRIGIRSLIRSQTLRPLSVFFQRRKPAIVPNSRNDDEPARAHQVRRGDDPLRQRRQLAAELAEDLHEDRDEEHQHPDQHERREDQDHDRVDHRPLHAPLDLRVLLDLERDAVEHLVEDSRSLAGLDHRHVQAREDFRMSAERLGQQQAALHVRTQLADDLREVLSSVCSSRITRAETTFRPASIIVANWREKICSDFGDLLEDRADRVLTGRRQLLEIAREQTAHSELLACRGRIRRTDLAVRLQSVRVDRRVRERRHGSGLNCRWKVEGGRDPRERTSGQRVRVADDDRDASSFAMSRPSR